ncbi:ATP-binding response regulator [Azospirillum rugosum]|uniref:histidine kinase n=1 Tax=Azospirillum rugosum TaxID=416170 RepID=A0ABS4SWU4_9PROT|nr:hybrid sensor histidine kinase/response regulator [Azospirillum rugosum]MBP2297028.1 signal transduction histidine kinase/FixJ family two-component response regulator/regulator of replication initiation timing [Azospirillum rugosum]MDQ0530660.1 signal transduction histidine kinase/FixJ family two-component response regulator/regulator of replication initiation timing [Azospirillum rugosum]
MGGANSVLDDGDADRASLLRRITELDQGLEQALVTIEDGQEQIHALVEERDGMEAELAAQRAEIAELRGRLTASEETSKALAEALDRSDHRLRKVRSEEHTITEELQASYEELQMMAQQLEEANAELELRVTERTAELAEANAALRCREEQLRFAQQCAKAGSWDWDLTADRMVWSPECYDLLGLDPRSDRPSLDRLLAAVVPDDRPVLRRAVADSVAADSDDVRLEFRVRRPGIGLRWIANIGRVVWRDLKGQPTRITGLAFDTTDRKALEEDLRRAKEVAEAADRAKTRFLAAASHDLRQPIQAASLYTYVLRSSIQEHDTEGAEVLDLLKASIESLSGMLSGLLDLSRLEAGAVEVSVANILPDEMMARLAAEFAAVAGASGVTLRFLHSTAAIATDPRLFERVLRNLIANAIAHGRRDDRGRVLVGVRRRRNGVEFQVWDTGPGIPESAREAIFEEFRQLHNPARAATQGFGLGLSIVNRIARLLKLEVTVRSQVGRGSLFSVLVPHATGPDVARPAAAAADTAIAPWLRGRSILLVEDDEQVRRGLTMMLKRWGVRVDAVSSAEELAAKLPRLRRRPHAVLTDYRLPGGGTGRKVVELVRSRWDVPGIIITGDTAPERLREAMSIGCRLLHKPIEPSELMGALGEAMQGGIQNGNTPPRPTRAATRSRRARPEAAG